MPMVIVTIERADFSRLLAKLELPLFRGPILQFLRNCIARVGGWEHFMANIFSNQVISF